MARFLQNFLVGIDALFARVIKGLLVAVLLGIAGITFSQVILRDVWSTGLSWADVVARHLVLWIALMGGMMATRSRQHIAIDVLTRMLPHRPRNAVRIALDAISCVVAILLARASWAFMLDERAAGDMLSAHIPQWWVQLVLPFGFAVIAFEYAVGVVLDVWRIMQVGSHAHTAGEGWKRTKYVSR